MPSEFYLPENPEYTIVDSARDSVRFAHYCLESMDHGKWRAMSSWVDPDGRPNTAEPLGSLEGTGWAANALGGAYQLYAWGRFDNNHILQKVALGLIDHVLEDGFLLPDGFVRGYRNTATGDFLLNSEGIGDWFCPGSMAKTALQMLWACDILPETDERVGRLREYAPKTANWLLKNDATVDGWYPSRCAPDGSPHTDRGASAGGLYIVWLLLVLTERGLGNHAELVRERLETVVREGGIYGRMGGASADSSVGRAMTYRLFRRAARFFGDPALGSFALEDALTGLKRFQMMDDRDSAATKGLLRKVEGGEEAGMWENAECSLAYLEAFEDTGDRNYLCNAVTILRAIAKHHYGPHGFLASGVVWENDSQNKLSHTHPLFSNLHHIESALRYLERHAV